MRWNAWMAGPGGLTGLLLLSACAIPDLVENADAASGGGSSCAVACEQAAPSPMFFSSFDKSEPEVGATSNFPPSSALVAGMCGQAMTVFQASDAMRLPEQGQLDYQRGALWLWFRPDNALGSERRNLAGTFPYPSKGGLRVKLESHQLVLMASNDDGSSLGEFSATVPDWQAGVWRHVAVSWDLTGTPNVEMTLDGCPLSLSNATTNPITPRQGTGEQFLVGASGSGDVDVARGALDEVRVYSQPVLPND